MMPKKQQDKERLSEELYMLGRSDKLIVVEGKKDKAALRRCGVTNKILTLKGPLYRMSEKIADESRDVVILTDLDPTGKKLFGTLSSQLQRLGVRLDHRFRKFLYSQTEIRQIEGIDTYMETIRR